MSAMKGLSWTVSSGGRRALRGLAFSIMGGTYLAHYLPHTLLIDKVKEVTQLYRKGIGVPISANVTSLVEEVMGVMGMGEEERGHVHVYNCYGFDLYSAGSTRSRNGCILGVPSNLRWESVEDFDGTSIMVNNTSVPWSSSAGQSLKNSLVLSEKAKKFIMARELAILDKASPLTLASVPVIGLIVAYCIGLGINRHLNLYARPRSLRLCLYMLASSFGFSVYILLCDSEAVRRERQSDGAAASLGKEYAEGGVELYTKVLQRNVALRHLMGSDGEKMFSAMGNEEVLFRTRHLPITMRLDALKKRLEEYEKEEEVVVVKEEKVKEEVVKEEEEKR